MVRIPLTNDGRPTVWQRMLASVSSRGDVARRSALQYGTLRDMYAILGYDSRIDFDDYLGKYRRQDIAGTIVDAAPLSTWRIPPEIIDPNGPDTPFAVAWADMDTRLRINPHSWLQVDRLAGIGHYGVLMIGEKGGDLKKPLPKMPGGDAIIFLASFHEGRTDIVKFDNDPSSPRFGRPELYKITLSGETRADVQGKRRKREELPVHWTRIVHVAEDTIEDNAFGTPRLERVYNRLDDLMKISGGSAEMFWQNVARLWWFNVAGEFEVDKEEMEALEEQLLEVMHGLRRMLTTQGGTLQPLGGDAPAPRETFDVLIDLIAAAKGIPKRILLGSERGELASTQDEANWLGRIASRQQNFAEPVIVRAFIDRLIEGGALPEPTDGYLVVWPNLFKLTELEMADRALKVAQASSAIAVLGEAVLPVHEFREEFLGLQPELPPPPELAANIRTLADIFDRPNTDQFWRTIHRVADGLVDQFGAEFIDAVRTVRTGTSLSALERALAGGDLAAIETILPTGLFRQQFGEASGALMEQAFLRTAELAARAVSGELDTTFTFETTGARVDTFAIEEGARLVSEISAESSRAVARLVETGFREGTPARELARRIRDGIGLDARRQTAVDRHRATLVEAGVKGRQLDQSVALFAENQLRQRAETIARNELARAANAGQQAVFKQLERDGLVARPVVEWLVTPDDRLCPICLPMDGQRVLLGDTFVSPTNGQRALHPPIHVNCRCAVALVPGAELDPLAER